LGVPHVIATHCKKRGQWPTDDLRAIRLAHYVGQVVCGLCSTPTMSNRAPQLSAVVERLTGCPYHWTNHGFVVSFDLLDQ